MNLFVFIPVHIIHIGDELSSKLAQLFQTYTRQSYDEPTFQARDFRNTSDAPFLIELTLEECKKNELPLLVILTKKFFTSIWKTKHKTRILKMLLNYPTSHCVHIWMDDVTDDLVETYSTSLIRNDNHFRQVCDKQLPTNTDQMVKKILNLMKGTKKHQSLVFNVLNKTVSFIMSIMFTFLIILIVFRGVKFSDKTPYKIHNFKL